MLQLQLRRTLRTVFLIVLMGSGMLWAAPARAQGERCFSETGYCISGEIRRFWEQSGGLAVFGYPLTPLQQETIEGRTLLVQWFERHRLELHPTQPWPYTVQLGRLGVDRLAREGRAASWGEGPDAASGCRFFAESGHSVCGEFLSTWRSAGIEMDGRRGTSEAENLALFGLPLSAPQQERLANGQIYTVQWFERARMELHPELPPGSRVLMGLLGVELNPQPQAGPRRIMAQPTRISIAAIGLDTPIVSVGLDAQGVPVVPKYDVGWYNLSAAPGAGENVVLWGHVLRWRDAPNTPAPFARLKELRPGATINLTTSDGARHTYTVRQQVWARPDEVAYILPQGREVLTLVSCIGDQVIQGGEVVDMSHRLITIATP
jgi:hypothetical protein